VDHVAVREVARDQADRVCLADVGEELVPEALTHAGSAHDARDVDEGDGGGDDPLAAEDRGEPLEPGVAQGDDADVRLDRRERVVRREHGCPGQRVEEGGLADVGQPDDADGEGHGGQF